MYYKNFKEQVLLHMVGRAERGGSKMGTQTLDPCWWTYEKQFEKDNGYIAIQTSLLENKIYKT